MTTVDDGAEAMTYRYNAAGEVVELARPNGVRSGAHTFLFTGEQYNPNLDLYYLRARHDAPASARFTQADSFRGSADHPLTLHRYAYAHNSPVTNRDPSGHLITTLQLNAIRIQMAIAMTQMRYFVNRLAPPLVNGMRQLSAYAAPLTRLPAALRGGQATTHIYYGLVQNGRECTLVSRTTSRDEQQNTGCASICTKSLSFS